MPHFFDRRDRWGLSPSVWIVLGMLFALPLALGSLGQVRMDNDVENWLSDDSLLSRQFRWYSHHFPHEDNFVLTWEGSHLDDPRIAPLVAQLEGTPGPDGVRRGGLPQVSHVRTPGELIARMTKLGIPRDEAVERVQGVFAGPGKIQVQLSGVGQSQLALAKRTLIEGAAAEFGIDLILSPPLFTGETAETASEAAAEESHELAAAPETQITEAPADEAIDAAAPAPFLHDFQVSWQGMNSGVSDPAKFLAWAAALRLPVPGNPEGEKIIEAIQRQPGAPVGLIVGLNDAGTSELGPTLDRIRSLATSVGIQAADLHLGGTPVASAALNRAVSHAAWNAEAPWYLLHRRSIMLLSGLVGIVLACWLLKSIRMSILVLVVAYYTTIITLALVPATGGSMNMVLAVMPTLLLVVTISGAVHVANYWRHAAVENPTTAIATAERTARWPCFLASVTTAIGLASLVTSPLAPVRDFGFYAAIGTLLSLAAVLYALPALLQIFPIAPGKSATGDVALWHGLGDWLTRHARLVNTVNVALFAFCVYGLTQFRTETKVIRYFPETARVFQDYAYLEENLAGIVPVDTVVRFDKTAQENLNFVERMEIVRAIQRRMQALPDISGTISLADFQPVAEPLTESPSFREKLQRQARSKAVEDKAKKDAAAKSLLVVAPAASEFSEAGDELWRVTAQVAVLSQLDYTDLIHQLDEICQSETRFHAGTQHVVTGMVPLFLATQKAVLDSLITSFGMSFALVAVIMVVLLKHPISGLLSMWPNILPIGMVFGLISWAGMAVDIGTMITASVGLGMAVDGTVHLLTWFQDGLAKGLSRREATKVALGHCAPAMWQTSAAVGLGMLMLWPAELLLISRFGWLMAALIGTALYGDLIVLPALLETWLGRLIEARLRKTTAPAVAQEPATAEAVPEEPAGSQATTLVDAAQPAVPPPAEALKRRVDSSPHRKRNRHAG